MLQYQWKASGMTSKQVMPTILIRERLAYFSVHYTKEMHRKLDGNNRISRTRIENPIFSVSHLVFNLAFVFSPTSFYR